MAGFPRYYAYEESVVACCETVANRHLTVSLEVAGVQIGQFVVTVVTKVTMLWNPGLVATGYNYTRGKGIGDGILQPRILCVIKYQGRHA